MNQMSIQTQMIEFGVRLREKKENGCVPKSKWDVPAQGKRCSTD